MQETDGRLVSAMTATGAPPTACPSPIYASLGAALRTEFNPLGWQLRRAEL